MGKSSLSLLVISKTTIQARQTLSLYPIFCDQDCLDIQDCVYYIFPYEKGFCQAKNGVS